MLVVTDALIYARQGGLIQLVPIGDSAMTDQRTHDLANTWAALWDGDLTQTPRIIAADFVSHAAPLTGGPAGDS